MKNGQIYASRAPVAPSSSQMTAQPQKSGALAPLAQSRPNASAKVGRPSALAVGTGLLALVARGQGHKLNATELPSISTLNVHAAAATDGARRAIEPMALGHRGAAVIEKVVGRLSGAANTLQSSPVGRLWTALLNHAWVPSAQKSVTSAPLLGTLIKRDKSGGLDGGTIVFIVFVSLIVSAFLLCCFGRCCGCRKVRLGGFRNRRQVDTDIPLSNLERGDWSGSTSARRGGFGGSGGIAFPVPVFVGGGGGWGGDGGWGGGGFGDGGGGGGGDGGGGGGGGGC